MSIDDLEGDIQAFCSFLRDCGLLAQILVLTGKGNYKREFSHR
jgi:hypothetical protein